MSTPNDSLFSRFAPEPSRGDRRPSTSPAPADFDLGTTGLASGSGPISPSCPSSELMTSLVYDSRETCGTAWGLDVLGLEPLEPPGGLGPRTTWNSGGRHDSSSNMCSISRSSESLLITHGCITSSSAVIRNLGFLCRSRKNKSCSSILSAVPTGNSTSFSAIVSYKSTTVEPSNGNLPNMNEYSVTPSAQTSAANPSYSSPAQISGARNAGVPSVRVSFDVRLPVADAPPSCMILRLCPKSAIFTVPSPLSNMFSGLMSPCTIPSECR
mmetsp:Transcript_13279/g.38534  ORF Transcript_13279/g.38534 Transcript_13279/m.38534 type:complete len:269 (-) Transcript_13279:459-1265(-)